MKAVTISKYGDQSVLTYTDIAKQKKFRRGTLVNSRHLALSLAGRGKT
jgi:hypothetical protein